MPSRAEKDSRHAGSNRGQFDSDSAREAGKKSHGGSGLVGQDSNAGIITHRDVVVHAVAEGMGVNTSVRDAMSDEVLFVTEDD